MLNVELIPFVGFDVEKNTPEEKNEDLGKKYEETLTETLKKYLHVNKKVNEILNEEEGGDNNE